MYIHMKSPECGTKYW